MGRTPDITIMMRQITWIGLALMCLLRVAPAQTTQEEEQATARLKQVMEANVAALASGCVVEYKWLFSRIKGPRLPLNSERTFRMAIKGEDLLVESWYSARYNPLSNSMVSVREDDLRAAFGGLKYIETDGESYSVSRDRANVVAINDAFQAYPLTAMFAFLVPRQGHVLFADVASPSNWSAYISDIKNIAHDPSGNLVIKTLRADGISQEVTFSAANGFYPSKIVLRWDNQVDIQEVTDWTKVSLFGKNLGVIPKTIKEQGGEAGKTLLPVSQIDLNAQSLAKIPDTVNYFTLPSVTGCRIHDMDVNADVRVP